MSNEVSPYVGPRPFEAKDHELFFGREREASELFSLIFAHPIVLFYAQSGAGKTSLLNAKLIPMLREDDTEVFLVDRLRMAFPEETDLGTVDNPFALSSMLKLADTIGDGDDPNRLMHMTLGDYLAGHPHPTDEAGESLPRVLIFDQFEELSTAYPAHWDKREAFMQQIVKVLEDDPLLRVLMALREDFVAQFDSFSPPLRKKLRTRYRMERLRAEAAKHAIEGPLAKTDRSYGVGVAEALVQNLLLNRMQTAYGEIEVTEPYVEPVHLQVVCSSIWDNLPVETKTITERHLQKFGNVEQALETFYDHVIDEAVRQYAVEESRLRRWCEEVLITAIGTRNTIYRGLDDTGGMDNVVIDILENQHLIRAEHRAGAHWYELTHDRLIQPIRTSNETWFAEAERRARALRVALVGVLFVGLMGLALIFAHSNATLQFHAAYLQAQDAWLATREPGFGGSIPLYLKPTLTPPQDFLATATAQAAPWEPVVEEFNCEDGACVEMVLVPPGCFWMGSQTSSNEEPVHEVCFDVPFWIDAYEVSNAQFKALGGQAVSTPDWEDPQQPRTSVTWIEAFRFCYEQRGRARLPTEAEWEYAARGPDSRRYPWGNDWDEDKSANGHNSTHVAQVVGSYPGGTSWVGAQDMSGNAWEWVHTKNDLDRYPYPYATDDGREEYDETSVRVWRGGSFYDYVNELRSAFRLGPNPDLGKYPDNGSSLFGFRCVRYAEP